ncbi:MAG: cytochrome ubiquinol oxidase subunit I [Actinomycetota bacterium]|nr:cytochrome ubiquinol oxidase subunit I [Actinomycetota bacterium]
MTTLLDRWQFGVTITYHFLFVPLTIGLGLLVAWMQTLAYRRQDADWDRLSRFFGKLFLINFALGVVTGIVQEFQFGMNWSNYSIFVGNIFGAPLAMEGLLAFFLESTFLGLWIFGRGRLSKRVHLTCIWMVAFGSTISALFILAANAWMQHPVGYKIVDHKALLTDFWAVFANSTLWEEFAHTVLAAFVTGAMVVAGVSAWQMLKRRDVDVFARSAKLATAFAAVCLVATITTGDLQARLMDEQQPMKMAAAEALYNTQAGASFSLLTIGNLSGQPIFQIRVPHLLSLIADMNYDGKVSGINQIQRAEVKKYGPGSYVPVIWVTYWTFRLMVGLGFLMLGVAAWAWWISRKRSRWRLATNRWTLWVLVASIVAPFAANTSGWLFTEMGRQPWIVYGLMKTSDAISPTVGAGSVIATLAGLVVLYSLLGAIDIVLMSRAARASLPPTESDAEGQAPGSEDTEKDTVASLVY